MLAQNTTNFECLPSEGKIALIAIDSDIVLVIYFKAVETSTFSHIQTHFPWKWKQAGSAGSFLQKETNHPVHVLHVFVLHCFCF